MKNIKKSPEKGLSAVRVLFQIIALHAIAGKQQTENNPGPGTSAVPDSGLRQSRADPANGKPRLRHSVTILHAQAY